MELLRRLTGVHGRRGTLFQYSRMRIHIMTEMIEALLPKPPIRNMYSGVINQADCTRKMLSSVFFR